MALTCKVCEKETNVYVKCFCGCATCETCVKKFLETSLKTDHYPKFACCAECDEELNAKFVAHEEERLRKILQFENVLLTKTRRDVEAYRLKKMESVNAAYLSELRAVADVNDERVEAVIVALEKCAISVVDLSPKHCDRVEFYYATQRDEPINELAEFDADSFGVEKLSNFYRFITQLQLVDVRRYDFNEAKANEKVRINHALFGHDLTIGVKYGDKLQRFKYGIGTALRRFVNAGVKILRHFVNFDVAISFDESVYEAIADVNAAFLRVKNAYGIKSNHNVHYYAEERTFVYYYESYDLHNVRCTNDVIGDVIAEHRHQRDDSKDGEFISKLVISTGKYERYDFANDRC